MNGAHALIRTLVDAGVDTCFTNPGTSEMHFVAALDDVGGMRGILGLFEGVATGAADGYARIAGRPAATLLHLGPGLGNGLANLHNARRAGSPVVNIVGDHATYHKRYDAPLESDIAAIASGVSGWVRTSARPEDLAGDGADAVADARGFPFHFLQRQPDHYANLADTAVEMGSGMHPFNHAHAIGFAEGIAREYDVITHGFVPELLFRGSSLPKVARRAFGLELGETLDPTLSKANLPERLYRRGYSLLGTKVTEMFCPSVREVLDETLLVSARQMIAEAASCSDDVYDQFLWPDVHYHGRYPSMLFEHSLRHYMTERSLVFGNEVIDLHLKMPVAVRADNRLWMKAVALLSPKVARATNANTGYPAAMPVALEALVEAGKAAVARLRPGPAPGKRWADPSVPVGYSPISYPRFDWMIRNNERLRELTVDTLHDDAALPPTLFDRDRVRELLNDHLADRGSYRIILFALMTFGRWHRKHGAA